MNSRPNVLVIVIDALRARNLSCYGYKQNATPGIDAFASESLLFQRAFTTATWTIPTHASLLTGLYLSQHGIENAKANRRFNPEIATLPEVLGEHGYRTAAFSQNRLFSPEHNFDIFKEFHELQSGYEFQNSNGWNKWRLGRAFNVMGRYRSKISGTRKLFEELQRWIVADEDSAFLAVVNCTAVHYAWAVPLDILLTQLGSNLRYITSSEYVDPKPFQFNSGRRAVTAKHREVWLSLYDAAIKYVDREIHRFLEALNRWSRSTNTIVIITSDHGEMLGENQDIFGHTLCLHDNILHIPLMIRHPDYMGGKRVEGVVQLLDLYPSILEWCHIPAQEIPPLQLQRPPLSAAIANSSKAEGIAIAEEDYSHSYDVRKGLLKVNPEMDTEKYPRQQIAVRSATDKLIWRSDQSHELYDLANDPQEKDNLIQDESRSETLEALQNALESWRSRNQTMPPVELDKDAMTDPEVYSRLKALGYLG